MAKKTPAAKSEAAPTDPQLRPEGPASNNPEPEAPKAKKKSLEERVTALEAWVASRH